MRFPVSDHCDGERFFNPEAKAPEATPEPQDSPRGMAAFLRWRLSGSNWSRWPAHVPNHRYDPLPPLGAGRIGLTFIGHSTFLIRIGGITLLTDPVFSARCSPSQAIGPKRVRDPGIALAHLPPIDAILLSHNHYDHCDAASLKALADRFPAIQIAAPLGNAPLLRRFGLHHIIELDWWDAADLAGARLTATPARHFARRGLTDTNHALWSGFMLEAGDARLYFAGDSGATKFFAEIGERLGPADLALLPIGAYEPRWMMQPVHMNPAEAVRAFLDLGAKQAVGMHFGTFQLTGEAIDAPLHDLAAARQAAGLGSEFTTLDVGESKIF